MDATTSAASGTSDNHTPDRWSIPRSDAYALRPDIDALELGDQTHGDAQMHGADADMFGTSAG